MAVSHRGQGRRFQKWCKFWNFQKSLGRPWRGSNNNRPVPNLYTWWRVAPYIILPKYNIGEFPQPVSLLLFGQNLRGYIPATPDYINIKFTGYVDTISACCRVFSKSGLPVNVAPKEGQIFRYAPTVGPLADKFTLR